MGERGGKGRVRKGRKREEKGGKG
jgi:hypothetical protein